MKNTLITLLIFAFSTLNSKAQTTFNLSVKVNGISEVKGKLYASVINDFIGFPSSKALISKSIEVDSSGLNLEFTSLAGETDYAIILFHDLNDNGILDMSGDMPSEPFGFSNYQMMGPPTWDDCSFVLDENKSISINLYHF